MLAVLLVGKTDAILRCQKREREKKKYSKAIMKKSRTVVAEGEIADDKVD